MKRLFKLSSLILSLFAFSLVSVAQSPCNCSDLSAGTDPCPGDPTLYVNVNAAASAPISATPFFPAINFSVSGTTEIFCTIYTIPAGVTTLGVLNFFGLNNVNNSNWNRGNWQAYDISGCSAPISGTIVSSPSGGAAEFSVTPGATYKFCVTASLTANSTNGNIDGVEFYFYNASTAGSESCDCITPNCTNDLIASISSPTFNNCVAYPGDETGTTVTTYYTLTSSPSGTLGFVQQVRWDNTNGGCLNTDAPTQASMAGRTYALYTVNNCGGLVLAATTANAGNSATLNPEWTNLSPSTQYVLVVTLPLTSCGITETCLDYYYPLGVTPAGCGTLGFDSYLQSNSNVTMPTSFTACDNVNFELKADPKATAGEYIAPGFIISTTGTVTITNIQVKEGTNAFVNAGTQASITYCSPELQYQIIVAGTGAGNIEIIDHATGNIIMTVVFSTGTTITIPPNTINGTATFSGPGVTTGTNGKAVFNPSLAGNGTHTITYSWNNSITDCGTTTLQVTVSGCTTPAAPCGDCLNPACNIFLSPNGANSPSGTYPSSNHVIENAIAPTTITECHLITVANNNQTLGFRQGVVFDAPFGTTCTSINRTWELKQADVNGQCTGNVIPQTATGPYSVIFNPEWDYLPAGNYILCVTQSTNAPCNIDYVNTGYYLENLPPPVVPPCPTNTDFIELDWLPAQAGTGTPFIPFPSNPTYTCTDGVQTIWKAPEEDVLGPDPSGTPTNNGELQPFPGFRMNFQTNASSNTRTSLKVYVNGQPFSYYGPAPAPAGFFDWGPNPVPPQSQIVIEPYLPQGATITIEVCDSRAASQSFPFTVYDYSSGATLLTGTAITPNASTCYTITFTLASPTMTWVIDGNASLITNNTDGSATFDPANLTAGPHVITYTYNNGLGCTLTATQNIIVTAGPTIAPTFPNICAGLTSAAFTYTSTGSPITYSIDWNAAANSAGLIDINNQTLSASPQSFTILGSVAAGTYTGSMTVINAAGCVSAAQTVTLILDNCGCTPPAAPSASGTTICAGETASLTATGVGGATFNWYDAASAGNLLITNANFTTPALSTTTSYWVSQTSGCESARTEVIVDINPAGAPQYTLAKTDVVCGTNGTITINPIAGTLTYNWISGLVSPIGASSLPNGATDESALIDLSAGNYCVDITNTSSGGGTTTTTILTEDFESAGGYTIDNTTQESGEASSNTNVFVVNNQYAPGTCNWGAGSYTTPTISNQNAIITGNIQSAYLHIVATTTPGVTCGAGSSNWLPGSPNYASIVSNQLVTLNTILNTTAKTNVTLGFYWLCGGDVSGNDYGQFEYSVNGGVAWTACGAKLYNSAAAWTQTFVTLPAFDNQADLRFRLRWVNNGSSSIDPPLAIDQITVTADQTVSATCPATVNECFLISDSGIPGPPTISPAASYCQGAAIAILSATGNVGSTITWYSDAALTTQLGTGPTYSPSTATSSTIYYATQTVNSCESAASSVQIDIYDLPVLAISSQTDQTCPALNDGVVVLNASGGSGSGSWSYSKDNGATYVGTNNFTGLAPGSYTFIVKDGTSGCTSSISATILPATPFTLSVVPDSVCIGTSVNMTVTGVSPFTWVNLTTGVFSSGSTLSENITTQTVISVTDNCNTLTPIQKTINVYSAPVITVSANKSTICIGETVNLNAGVTGGKSPLTLLWAADPTLGSFVYNSNTTTAVSTPNSSTTFSYNISVTDNCGLTDNKDVSVIVNPLPQVEIAAIEAICEDNTLSFNNIYHDNTMVQYQWDFGAFTSNSIGSAAPLFSNSGLYTANLTVIDVNGCSNAAAGFAFEVLDNPVGNIVASDLEKSILNPYIAFDGSGSYTNISQYLWDFAGYNTASGVTSSFLFPDTGYHNVSLVVINDYIVNGTTYYCADTVTIPIYIKDELALFIPNAFTPNGDGENDVYMPKGFGFVSYEIRIFDRWGEQIFYSDDIDKGWDGRLNGGSAEPIQDVYVYHIVVETLNRKEKERVYTGHITLLR